MRRLLCLMAIATSPTTLSQITGELQWSVHISAYHSMSRSMRMMVDMLIALTTSGWRDRRREHTSSFDDGHHHVADGVEPISKGNTVFCSDRCASFDAPLISDEGSRAPYITLYNIRRLACTHRTKNNMMFVRFVWCVVSSACVVSSCVVASFAEVSNGGSQDHNWECD